MPKAGKAAQAATDAVEETGGADAPAPTAQAAKAATTTREEGAKRPGESRGRVTRGVDLGQVASKTLSDQEDKVNGLWFGREGSGKTTDVLTAANRGRILVINAEAGVKKKPLRDFGIDLDNVIIWPEPGNEDQLTVDNLDALSWQLRAQLQEDPNSWFAVIWDSASELYEAAVTNARLAEFDKNAALPVAKQKEHRLDPYFTDISDYGTATAQMRSLLRRYRDLPCHFLVTALERRDVDEETGRVQYGPAVGPAFQKDLLGYLDVVIHTEASQHRIGPNPKTDIDEDFVGRSRTDGLIRVKDRLKSIPRNLPTPTFERVLDYFEDRVTESDDPLVAEWIAAQETHLEWLEKDREAKAARRQSARGR